MLGCHKLKTDCKGKITSIPLLQLGLPSPIIPESRGTGAGVQSHTDHTEALREQHKWQQEPIQEGLVCRKEDKWGALLRDREKEMPILKTQPNPSICKSQGSTEGGRASLHVSLR